MAAKAGRSPLAETVRPVLVLALFGWDAVAVARVREDMGLPCSVCADVAARCAGLSEDTPLVVIAEEGLAKGAEQLLGRLDAQPAWSDLPILLLSVGRDHRGADERRQQIQSNGNDIILDDTLQ